VNLTTKCMWPEGCGQRVLYPIRGNPRVFLCDPHTSRYQAVLDLWTREARP